MRNYLLVLTLLLIGIISIPSASAENESAVSELNISSSQITETSNILLLSFDGLSESKKREIELTGFGNSDFNIPSSIKKYDLLTFDVDKIREKLANNEMITVRIKGVPYKMNLHDNTGIAEGRDPAYRFYYGALENVKDSEIFLSISQRVLSGDISVNGEKFRFSGTPKNENGKVIQYVYSSADEVSEGQPAKWDNDYLGKNDYQKLSPDNRAFTDLYKRNLEEKMAISGPVNVRILIITDEKWITDVRQNESREWTDAADDIIQKANIELGKSYIQVNLIPIFDASKASELSADPQINHTYPLNVFINHTSTDYLDSKSADLAFYLGGYDCVDEDCSIGATYGYDSNNNNSRYGWTQMVDDPPSDYKGTDPHRTVITLHEIGHIFDADHQNANNQTEDYNRAYQYGIILKSQTVVWAPFLTSTGYDYSSTNNNGDVNNDNARRISETKGVVASYYTEPPLTDFTATPRTGPAPLAVQFTDASTGSPTAWEWNFGDENMLHWSPRYGHTSHVMPDGSIVLIGGEMKNDTWRSTDNGTTWTLLNSSSGWLAREDYSSVVTPDGTIVLMGGFDLYTYLNLNDTWQSTDNGATWTEVNSSSGWSARHGHTSVALSDGSIVLIGGKDDSELDNRKHDVWLSSDKGTTWTLQTAGAAWYGRYKHSSVALPDGSIVMMGGLADYLGYADDVWRSTDKGKTWTVQDWIATWHGRMDHRSVVLPDDGSIVVIGGIWDNIIYNDVWRSTDKGVTFTLVNNNRSFREVPSSVVLPDGTILLTGGTYAGIPKNDIWKSTNYGATWSQVEISPTWISQEQNPLHTYQYPGTYTVKLNATNSAGSNTTTKTGYIIVGPPPTPLVAGFTASPTSGTSPLTVQFADTSSGSPTGWSWDFGDGDGTNATYQDPIHTYQIAGTYSVTLSVTNNDGSNMITKTGYISVTSPVSPPTAGFTASPTSGSAPLTVTFTDQSSGQITSWLWDVDNDGNTDCFAQACEYTFTNPGIYTSKIVVSGDGGFDNMTRTDFINVTVPFNPPVTNFTGTPTTGSTPLTVQFSDMSTNTPTNWIWNFGDNSTVNATQQNPIHTYSVYGIYSVSLTATNAGGSNTKTQTNYIVVTAPSPPPVAGFSGTPLSGTAPLTVIFTDSSTGYPTNWSWTFGDNSTENATQKNPVHTYLTNGIYTVSLTATNASVSNVTTKSDYIKVGLPDHIGIYRNWTHFFHLDQNGNGTWEGITIDRRYDFGIFGDIPIAGDWNGDGWTEIGVFRNSSHHFLLDYNGNGVWDGTPIDKEYNFGISNDTPVVGDWNGDGITEIGIFRIYNHRFLLDYNGNGVWDNTPIDIRYNYGVLNDLPVAGDWNGDGITEIGVFRGSSHTWYLDLNGDGLMGTGEGVYNFGNTGDLPVSGDWNGNGMTNIGVFRKSTKQFLLDYDGNGIWNDINDKKYLYANGNFSISGKWK